MNHIRLFGHTLTPLSSFPIPRLTERVIIHISNNVDAQTPSSSDIYSDKKKTSNFLLIQQEQKYLVP